MCLARVKGTPKKTTGFGWKVFRVIPGTAEKVAAGAFNCNAPVYDVETWVKADPFLRSISGTLKSDDGGRYRIGFHVALRREDARAFLKSIWRKRDHVVRQVEYRGAYIEGTGGVYFPGPQVIADEIRILKPRPGGSAYTKAKKKK